MRCRRHGHEAVAGDTAKGPSALPTETAAAHPGGVFPKTMVVPLDGSTFAAKAIPIACAILREQGGELLLVATRWDHDVRGPEDYLTRAAAEIHGLKVRTVVIQDRTAVEAIQITADDAPGRVVCMTSHGRGRLRWAFLGSVAEQVMSESHDPVVLLGRQCGTAMA